MSFTSNLQSIANTLLTNYGQAITVVRDNIGSYDVSTGTVTDSSDTNYSGVGYPEDYKQELIDNVTIKQKDIRLTFYSTTEPLVDDIFTVGSKVYTAQQVEKITAQGNNIIYIVQLRQ